MLGDNIMALPQELLILGAAVKSGYQKSEFFMLSRMPPKPRTVFKLFHNFFTTFFTCT